MTEQRRASRLASPPKPAYDPLFLLALATLGASVLIFVALVTGAACGSQSQAGGPTSGPSLGPTEEEPTAPAEPTPTAEQPTRAPVTAQSPTSTAAAGDEGKLVTCAITAPVDQVRRVDRNCTLGGGSLTAETSAAFERMRADALKEGLSLVIISGYRSFDQQRQIYDADVARLGPNQNQSAKPGHSEHQLGTTVDLNELDEAFGDTPEGQWLANNAVRYGFVMSYPRGREAQTGYAYEPWHFRYIGPEMAAAYAASGKTLNQFLPER
jgi:zinc D-Ala-D-Ala carboxypeptidase